MKLFVVLCVLAYMLAVVCASSYSAQAARSGRRSPANNRRAAPIRSAALSSEGNEEEPAPEPYKFEYSVDEGEAKIERQEEADSSGTVRGQYSYMDPNGIFRTVRYVADENGFRPEIDSNEPGLGTTENPADVIINAQQPPAGAYDPPRKSKKRKSQRNYY